MGEFNAQIGSSLESINNLIGLYTIGKRTRNGEKLVNLCLENNLAILNTQFKKRKNNMWTWISPDGKYKNQIDFILSNKRKAFDDCNIVCNLNFNTNHRMVRAKLKINPHKKSRKHIKMIQCPKGDTLPRLNADLKEQLKNYKTETECLGIQEKYNYLQDILKKTLTRNRETIGKNSEIADHILTLQEERAQLINMSNKTKDVRQKIAILSKQIRTQLRKERINRRQKSFEENIIRTGGIKKAIKSLTKKKDWIPNIKSKIGVLHTKRPDILKTVTNFYKELYAKQTKTNSITIEDRSVVAPIMEREVEKAIGTQKKDKAPGSDNITNEFIMGTKSALVPTLTAIFNEVLTTETVPTQWTKSTIVLIHKKGDRSDVGNYRPISLMSNLYKIFAKIILSRITKVLDENQPREQAGFRSKYSVVDHVHVVKQVLEKYEEYGLPFHCCFVDYYKAFDSLEHDKIWTTLQNQGVEGKYIRIIKNIYTGSTATVKLEIEGEKIYIEKGVRQGDPLSPKLFTAVLEEVFRQIEWKQYGLKINGEYLTNLRFADDVILFAESSQDLQQMLTDLDTQSKQVGLNMNIIKTKAMTNREEGTITINNNTIEYVKEYMYLGQLITTNNISSKEIETRIGNAWKQYWSFKEIMKDPTMSATVKGKLFNTCILPILTYGCQTWALTKAHLAKLRTCQRSMERSMLGKRKLDKTPHVNIRKATRTQDATLKVKLLKWRWAGHTIRGEDKWSKVVSVWYPREGKRKKGRPIKRWEDEIAAIAGRTWTRQAKKREEWKNLEEAFAKGHTDDY